MALALFAGVPVAEFERSLGWYERLLGSAPNFRPHATEAVWELAEHRFLYIVERPAAAGHAVHTLFVDDLDAIAVDVAGRGIEPAARRTRTASASSRTAIPTATRSDMEARPPADNVRSAVHSAPDCAGASSAKAAAA